MKIVTATMVVLATLGLLATPGVAKTKAPTAGTLAEALRTAQPSITTVVVFTAASDPNKLLGRPGQYTSKVGFVDSRTEETPGAAGPSVDDGGSIEVFATDAAAKTRFTYVKKITSSSPLFAEYTCQYGKVLLRLSHRLTPDVTRSYDVALRGALQKATKAKFPACPDTTG